MAWKELLRFFASGTVIAIDSELDLVELAFQISQNNLRRKPYSTMDAGSLSKYEESKRESGWGRTGFAGITGNIVMLLSGEIWTTRAFSKPIFYKVSCEAI